LQIPENYSLNGASLNLVNNDTVNVLASVFGIGVHVWTINDDDAMDRMLDVDNLAGIMTDFPEKLMQKIEARVIVEE
jgi:glycerophosphoryl diester phosphodiesterase